MSHKIEPYEKAYAEVWNSFVEKSKNGTFLLNRQFMEYHADRFQDASIMVWNHKGRLRAVLPANRVDVTLHSHQGLSYGSLILDETIMTLEVLEIFGALVDFLREQGITMLVYKTIPHIYHRLPAEEDRYALFRFGAHLYRSDVLSVITMAQPGPVQRRRRRQATKGLKAGTPIQESDRYEEFWQILMENLRARHNMAPVHTLNEIRMLRDRFPDNIRLFTAEAEGEVLGGTVIFESKTVAHAQYIAASDRGRQLGALDCLLLSLIESTFSEKPFFDFGGSTEKDGSFLNAGLIEQKEGFGARTVTQDFYSLSLS